MADWLGAVLGWAVGALIEWAAERSKRRAARPRRQWPGSRLGRSWAVGMRGRQAAKHWERWSAGKPVTLKAGLQECAHGEELRSAWPLGWVVLRGGRATWRAPNTSPSNQEPLHSEGWVFLGVHPAAPRRRGGLSPENWCRLLFDVGDFEVHLTCHVLDAEILKAALMQG